MEKFHTEIVAKKMSGPSKPNTAKLDNWTVCWLDSISISNIFWCVKHNQTCFRGRSYIMRYILREGRSWSVYHLVCLFVYCCVMCVKAPEVFYSLSSYRTVVGASEVP